MAGEDRQDLSNPKGGGPSPGSAEAQGSAGAQGPAKLPVWKTIVFSALSTALFFVLLEVVLMVVGVQPRLGQEDPFVGFASSVPLFVEKASPEGRAVMTTAANKRRFFNLQEFPRKKQPGAYRIFCLGGSTTYGRPYPDETSFCGWLRELLPVADPSRRWEVVNAGGISYASYRVAKLMEELLEYDPDLFIVYSGHNEFLEERSYRGLREIPGPVKSISGLLARTRTWAAMASLLDWVRSSPEDESDTRYLLPGEVRAKLNYSAGPELYERDDALQEEILTHYRFSLRRMVDLARSAGADILFVRPASNLKDFSPFKSQHTDGLGEAERRRSRELLALGLERMRQSMWKEALEALEQALAFDPRFAELHYHRGKTLIALGRYDEGRAALRRARDEDVCPLRALSSMEEAVVEVARETDTPLVDFVDLLEQWSLLEGGGGIAGKEYFLDHVHPSIEVHRRLAVELVELMAEEDIVQPVSGWGESAVSEVAKRVEKGLDPDERARALANLVRVLDWAGKRDEARRVTLEALESGGDHPVVLAAAGQHFGMEGKIDKALGLFREALRADPNNSKIHAQLGLWLETLQDLEAAAAHYFLASLLGKNSPYNHKQLGHIMAKRGRLDGALRSYLQASRLDPADSKLKAKVASLSAKLGGEVRRLDPPRISVTRFESGYPRTIAQVQPDSSGREVPDGIWTEWYDGGKLKSFADYSGGVRHGVSVVWDESGRPVGRTVYRLGAPVSEAP